MDLSLVAIGDEVLSGHTVNTNASTVAMACSKKGRIPRSHSVVGDNVEEMEKVLRRELALGGDVIAFGGLGPTLDDCTREVAAKMFQRPLILHQEYAEELKKRYGKEFPTIQNQATQPQGATLLSNSVGTAPGLILQEEKLFPGARLFVLPGPPQELLDVFTREVFPRLDEGKKIPFFWMTLAGVLEHEVDAAMRSLQEKIPSLHIGIYPSYGTVTLHVAHDEQEVLKKAHDLLRDTFKNVIFPQDMSSPEAYCLHLLQEKGWTVATAESCTGGGVAARFASVQGASRAFLGGIVAYRDSVKESMLAVPNEIIEKYGAVSQEVTEHMAASVKTRMGSDVVVATSGYFGPTGGTHKAPLGTVCVTFLLPGVVQSETLSFHGTRCAICDKAIGTLLAHLILLLKK